MDQLIQLLAQLAWWGWLLIALVASSIAEGAGRALSGRRVKARLRGELKASKAELARLHELVANTTRALDGNGTPDVSALAGQARGALDDRAHVLDLLGQIQATDRAWPQLPQELRDEIDQALLRLRSRPAVDRS